jgi:competence protein ComEA
MSDDDRPFGDPFEREAGPPPGWRERIDDLRSRWSPAQLAAGALLCVGVLVATVAFLRPASAHTPVEQTLPMASASASSASGVTTTTIAAEVVVHAAGAVVAPGLYRLPAGSRVADLIAAAGGLSPDADGDRVNLAAVLADGARVAVPRVGEPAPAVDPSGGAAATASASGPIDLNSATATELDALPGIGPATAKLIVDDRERNGPFHAVDDLLRVRGIGPAKLDQLRALVTVG